MENNNLINEHLDDEIDLIKLFRTLYSSKKLIIIVTLAFSLLAFIYATQKEAVYQSTVILEVGSYDLINDEKKLIEPVSSVIKKLRINQISKNLNILNFKSIEDYFLEINYTSPSPEFNENLINEAIIFVQESNMQILESQMRLQVSQLENQKSTIESNIHTLESKNNFLLKLIPEEENNLIKFQFYEQNLDIKNSIKSLNQKKDALELQVKLAKDQKSTTKPISELETIEIKTNTLLIILIGTILGFIFSALIVFIRQVFLKEQN